MKYGIKKVDKLNWIIYSTHKIKDKKSKNHGCIVEKTEGFYPNFEVACQKFVDFYLGEKLINKDFDPKKILKEFGSMRKIISKLIKKHESI